MITINDHKQQALFDPWAFICPKRRQLLDEGWPGLFRTHLLHELPVKEISPFFSSHWGRPSKELYSMLGALLLQQAMDLTDEHSVEHFASTCVGIMDWTSPRSRIQPSTYAPRPFGRRVS